MSSNALLMIVLLVTLATRSKFSRPVVKAAHVPIDHFLQRGMIGAMYIRHLTQQIITVGIPICPVLNKLSINV